MQLIPSNAWDRPADTRSTPRTPHPWGIRAVASAVLLATTLGASSAWALALGKVSVQSHLGQPLRAEIDLPNITTEEAASLQVGVASPETFQAAGMDFNPMLGEVRFVLERRPNGRTVLLLTSERAVIEPFLDVVVDVNWANGHLVRGYTMLFDPPNLKAATPAPVLPSTTATASTKPTAKTLPPAAPQTVQAEPAAPDPKSEAEDSKATQVQVKAGDTAGQIALANKPGNVTLEQMLVGMLRANPDAFIGSNVNRMKAGVVLDMPTETAATEVSPSEARRMIAAQSRDFNEYRRRLAAVAPSSDTETPSRSVSGSVQAEINDQQPSQPTPDKLTLSKGAVKTPDSTEAQIATQRQQADTSARQDELNRNLEDLQQLSAAASATESAEPPPPASEATPLAAPAVETPATPPAPPTPAPPQPATPEAGASDVLSSLLNHPLTLPAAGGVGGLLALLLGLGIYRRRKSKLQAEDGAAVDESMLEAGGGQSVDTDEAAAGPVSSMMYSPSQLDAGGDVDPIAEADVYLAYGRDKQAEEILIEALRLHPDRLNVRMKLLEIYAQRRDTIGFAGTATEVFQMTEGQGSDWEQARTLGQSIDPGNPLYQGSSNPVAPAMLNTDIDLDLSPESSATPDMPELDLELSEPASKPAPVEVPTESPAKADSSGLDFDFDLNMTAPEPAQPTVAAEPAKDDLGLDFDFDLTADDQPETLAPTPSTLPEEVQGLSLDLDTPTQPQVEADFDMLSDLEVDEGSNSGDPLETKLSLAQEFEAIGDTEGARSLAEEVMSEASGELKARAQAFLSQLP